MAPPTIEQEGDKIITKYCVGYENSTGSYVLPPLFNSIYTEERDKVSNEIVAPPISTREEDRKRIGLARSQSGEMSEYDAFSLFYELKQISLKNQLIFIRNIDLDNNNSHKIKEMKIKEELPRINLSGVHMNKELDGLAIVKQLGVVIIEVKRTASEDAIQKAVLQLNNGQMFIEALMGGIQENGGMIPCAKVIFVTEEKTPSTNTLTANNCFQIHKDQLENFQAVWDDIIKFLESCQSSFSAAEFTRLTRICVGIWSITPVKPGFTFNSEKASPAHQAKEIDKKVSQQVISSQNSRPLNDVHYCEDNTLFQKCKDIKVIYMTPEQKMIFDHCQCAIIRAIAGSGKTLLTMYKVIEIVENQKNAKVLIILPHPHDKRCRDILRKNGIKSNTIENFQTQSSNPMPGVFIISLKDFFHVTREKLLEYDTKEFHIFLDDIQSYRPPRYDHSIAKYSDILDFLNRSYESAKEENKFLWCCVDPLQSSCHYKDDDSSANLFYYQNGIPSQRSIPIVCLNKVLRNSSEVINFMSGVNDQNRKDRIQNNWIREDMAFGEIRLGHSITSAPVLYQKLQQGTADGCQISFVLQMLENELEYLLGSEESFTPSYIGPSDIAILYEKLDSDSLKQDIVKFIEQKHNFKTQSIEESIANDSNNAIVFDSFWNAMSYEVACVIFICQASLTVPYYGSFVVASRARTRLILIDYDVTKPPFDFAADNAKLVPWSFNQGSNIWEQYSCC